ncbi:MAG: hypothetical protein EXS18_04090 [Verrucomicrobiae bacterium]|nr:hypothetical protein [Verrucomicrobiae bacterium]
MSDTDVSRSPNASQLHSWSIVFAILALPILSYPLAWNHSLPHRFLLVLPIAVIYLIVMLAILVLHVREGESFQLARIERALLAVLGVGVISTMLSSNVSYSISAMVLLLANVSLFYVTSTWLDLHFSRRLTTAWLVAAVAEAAYALWMKAHGDFPVGTLGNKDWLAGFLAMSAVVCLPLGTAANRKPARLIAVGVGYLVMLAALFACHSTGAWLGCGTAILAVIVRILWTQRRMAALLVGGGVLIVGVAIALLNVTRLEKLWHENVRPPIWKGVLTMIVESHFIGTGLGTFTYEYAQYRPPEYFARPQATNLTDHAHNEFLEIAAESGIAGLGVMLWLLGIVLVRGWRGFTASAPNRWLALAAWGGVIVLVVHNLFDLNLRLPPNQTLLWLLMGLVIRCTHTPSPEVAPALSPRRKPTPAQVAADEKSAQTAARMGRLITMGSSLLLIALLAYTHVYRPVMADMFFRKAAIERDHEKWEPAMQNYLECLEHDPFRVEAWYRLAYICTKFNETDEEAIKHYLQVVEFAPDYGDVNTNLAYLYLKRDRKRDAIPYLQRAVETNPYNLTTQLILAHVYFDLNLSRELKGEVISILQKDPQNAWANDLWQSRFRLEKLDSTNSPPRTRKGIRPRTPTHPQR